MRDPLPRATARVVGACLNDFIDAATAALEGAVRAELPTPPAAPPRPKPATDLGAALRNRSPSADLQYVLARTAADRLGARGFVYAETVSRPDRGTVQVRARHSCGSLLLVEFTEMVAVAAPTARHLVDAVYDGLDAAGCYCVRPEVIVPCTAQRCEA